MAIKRTYEEFLRTVLCYPKYDPATYSRRLQELEQLEIREVRPKGHTSLGMWRILGKGHTGVVAAARQARGNVALKILRTDTDRISVEREVTLLSYANAIGVGPRLMRATPSMMTTELIEGRALVSWVNSVRTGSDFERCVRRLLFQGFRLDFLGLDHGELSRPDRHVVVQSGGNPVILDFESASINRRCNNLPSLVQYLFIRNASLQNVLANQHSDLARLLSSLRAYKARFTIESYREIMRQLGVE